MADGDRRPRQPGGAGLSAQQVRMRSMIQAIGMLPVLVILCIGFHYLSDGRFFTPQNVSIVAQQASINTVLAAGMTFVILTGGIDLSVGSILAASAMVGGDLLAAPRLGAARHPGRPGHRPVLRLPQRCADRLRRLAAVHRHAGLAHRGARHRPADGRRHHGVQPGPAVRLHRQCQPVAACPGSRSSPWS